MFLYIVDQISIPFPVMSQRDDLLPHLACRLANESENLEIACSKLPILCLNIYMFEFYLSFLVRRFAKQ